MLGSPSTRGSRFLDSKDRNECVRDLVDRLASLRPEVQNFLVLRTGRNVFEILWTYWQPLDVRFKVS